MKPILEKKFNYKGHPCVVLFMPGAYRCGYVGIPKAHKLAKHGANLDSISCHGGITYSESKLHCCDDEDTWWIGFDCAHFGDGYDIETAKQYFGDDPDFNHFQHRIRRAEHGKNNTMPRRGTGKL